MRPGFDFEPPPAVPDAWHHAWHHAVQLPGWVAPAVFLGTALLYALPSLVAFRRRHHNRVAILLLNLLLGWTGLGWLLALVWSATAVRLLDDPTRPSRG